MKASEHSATHVATARPRRGSVLIVVLVTIVFATAALLLFVERASTDLIVYVRDADRLRLRQEAYSALETTLAVLVDWKEVLGGLHSPAEGWSDPLDWIDYEPPEGMEVEVSFVDESGRISVSRLDFETLSELFTAWGQSESEAELWADALMGWMDEEYEPRSFEAPETEDYERADPAFVPPHRPLHSFAELKAIDVIREAWFDANGYPNEYARRFAEAVSLFSYSQSNINAAPQQVMAAVARYDEQQQELMQDYRAGDGLYRGRGVGYFTSADEMNSVLGESSGRQSFGTTIQALRIIVTVKQGQAAYRLNVVVAPSGGARMLASTLPRKESSDPGSTTSEEDASDSANTDRATQRHSAAELVAADGDESNIPNIEYPFTLLEIREIDAPPQLAEAALAPES